MMIDLYLLIRVYHQFIIVYLLKKYQFKNSIKV